MVAFSCRLPAADYIGFEANVDAIAQTAALAEELGFDAVVVNDHIVVDSSPRSAPWANTFDPFVTLAFVAARTSRIGVGTSVLIVPYRNPLATAKAFATLDQVSGGRAFAGVGTGWNEPEFRALGVLFTERGARTDESLRVWQACWGADPVSFAGVYWNVEAMQVRPKPVNAGGVPIWVGGSSAAALRRAARFGHSWQPMQMPLDELATRRGKLRAACDRAGRADMPVIRMSVRVGFNDGTAPDRVAGSGTPSQVADDLRRYRDGGVDAFQVNFLGSSNLDQLLASMRRFMAEVAPLVP